ncbi:TolC family protein [Massilia sp. TSP1-1-2]|uniref:TolC family protein n=1 Tax=Massilia sp. TSP1-1-2 TaxID=2804649 RepID=UPI003CF0BF4A
MSKQCALRTAIVLLLAASGAAAAATAADTVTRAPAPSFDRALRQAMLNDPELHKGALGVEIAEQETGRALSQFMPRMDLSAGTARIDAYGNVPGLETLLLAGSRYAYSASSSLSLTHNLYNGGIDQANLDVSREKVQEARMQYYLKRATLASQVLDQFHVLRQAELELRIAQVQQEAKDEQLRQVEGDFALGRRAALNVSEAQYEAQMRALASSTRERAYRNALRDLTVLIGEAPRALPAPAPASAPQHGYNNVLTRWGFGAPGAVNEVQLSASRIRQANLDVERAKGRYLPRLDIYARITSAGVNRNDFNKAYTGQTKDKRFIGFSLTWNLFDGFDTSSDVAASLARAAYAQADFKVVSRDLAKQINELGRPLADAEEDEQTERKRLELMQKKLGITRVKLELGKIDAHAVATAQTELAVQELELEKRSETIDYYKARLLLRKGAL